MRTSTVASWMWRGVAGLTLTTTALAAGCAGEESDGEQLGGGSGGVVTPVGGQNIGGQVATGGTGGAGGETGGGGSDPGLCGMDCSTIDTPPCLKSVCNEGQYPGDVGSCVVVDADTGTPCDDGLFCTVDDFCDGGQCQPGTQNTCGMAPPACNEIVCNEQTQDCSAIPAMDDTPCMSGDMCEVNATCQAGQCVGNPKDCTFAPVGECNTAVCNPTTGACDPLIDPAKNGQPCSLTGDLCQVGKTCDNGACVGGTPKDCSGVAMECEQGICDPQNGNCMAVAIGNGMACDDNDPCTVGETCDNGTCGMGAVTMMCGAQDFCCPAGCTELNDTDCALDILLLGDNAVTQPNWDTYRLALTSAGETWDELSFGTTLPDAATLDMYNTIIWFDQSVIGPGDTEVQKMVDWLNSGDKRLFMTSTDFLWDFQNGPAGLGEANMYSAMGTVYLGDSGGTGIAQLEGVMTDPIGDDFALPTPLLVSGLSSNDYADPTAGPAVAGLLYGPGGAGTGNAVLTHYTTGTYRLVWLGVNFHDDINQQAQRDVLMQNIINFFK